MLCHKTPDRRQSEGSGAGQQGTSTTTLVLTGLAACAGYYVLLRPLMNKVFDAIDPPAPAAAGRATATTATATTATTATTAPTTGRPRALSLQGTDKEIHGLLKQKPDGLSMNSVIKKAKQERGLKATAGEIKTALKTLEQKELISQTHDDQGTRRFVAAT